MHKVFVRYHHANDQRFKQCLVEMGNEYSSFIDRSVDIGYIDKGRSDQEIRKISRNG